MRESSLYGPNELRGLFNTTWDHIYLAPSASQLNQQNVSPLARFTEPFVKRIDAFLGYWNRSRVLIR